MCTVKGVDEQIPATHNAYPLMCKSLEQMVLCGELRCPREISAVEKTLILSRLLGVNYLGGESTPWAQRVRTCRQLAQCQQALWTFLEKPGIEPTSNAAERAGGALPPRRLLD
ncbi:hypothetical protein [Synechococcus sp. 1G10]|uniref:hypothetical protein n=1 Tax=Synechococcus sp. 1G10 TaxID=2025605 RepID=UPI00117D451F|nr:hypothetical protein [Synechococcus sp. 1G10]